MKQIITTLFLTILSLSKMEAQNFKKIETAPLSLTIYNAAESSFGVASVIIYGKTDAVLIDAQFTLADAEKVANEIKHSGKILKTIYISHGDPDFYFGIQVFKKYFPEVTVYASASTVENIMLTAQKKMDVWGGLMGNLIANNIVLPQVLKGNHIELEGQKLEIIGLTEFPHRTFVWIPAIKTVVGGINVFGNTFHLWMAEDKETTEKEANKNWVKALTKIEALNPVIVVPAHFKEGASLDLTSVKYSNDYIKFYEEALKTNKTSKSLIKALKAKYPKSTLEAALEIGAKVNTGETKW